MRNGRLTIDIFKGKVGHHFVVEEENVPPVELTLIEVNPLRNFAKLEREPFSLTFTSPGAGVLPQRIYTLRHAEAGLNQIFLVPVGGDAEKVTYQAVFN